MHSKKKYIVMVFVLIIMLAVLTGCKPDPELQNKTGNETIQKTTVKEEDDDEDEDNEEEELDKPYVPEGFSAVDDTIGPDEGFVIKDEKGNQYVWVPVKTGKLTSNASTQDYEDDASELTNSVSKYYGFYVARFEASQFEDDDYVAASMAGKTPWTNVSYTEARDEARKVSENFGYEDCYTDLPNGHAWDTILAWVDKDEETRGFSSSTEYGNYSGQILPTGNTSEDRVKNICDLAGNVREWTTETDKTRDEKSSDKKQKEIFRVLRGGSAELEHTPSKRISYEESKTNETWGFRFILYKK